MFILLTYFFSVLLGGAIGADFCFLEERTECDALSERIVKVTEAEPCVNLQIVHSFSAYIEKKKDAYLRGCWNALKQKIKHPEDLMPDFHIVFSGGESIYNRLDKLVQDIQDFKAIEFQHQLDVRPFDELLNFYTVYRERAVEFINNRNESSDGLALLYEYLQPKAVIMADLVDYQNRPWMFWRVKQQKARFITSLDESGRLKEKQPGANHYVECLPPEKPEVYFKLDGLPALQPVKEAMLQGLYQCLNIPVPQTKLMVIAHLFFGKHEEMTPYVIQASKAVPGDSAKALFELQDSIPDLDLDSFSYQVLGSLLTNPSDGKPRNFIHNVSERSLTSIDNDEVFNEAFNKKNYVSTKTILYLLPQMNYILPNAIKTIFANLISENIMTQWVHIFEKHNESWQSLDRALRFYCPLKDNESILLQRGLFCSLPISIEKKILENVQCTLQKIRQHIESSHTLFELLKKVDPLVYCFYADLLEKHKGNRMNAFGELHQDRTLTLNSWQSFDLGKHAIAIRDEEVAVLEPLVCGGDLIALTHLSLEGHQLSVRGMNTFIPTLGKLSGMKSLNVKALNLCNRETGIEWARGLATLFLANHLLFLSDLNLENCGLGTDGLDILIPTLKKLICLKSLNLGGNELSYASTKILDRYSSTISQLSDLNLRNNRFGCEGIQTVIRLPVFNDKDKCKNLKMLDFDNTLIGDKGVSSLSLTFLRLSSLIYLKLSKNEIGNQGVLKLCGNIKFLKSLECLTLSDNKISDVGRLLENLEKIASFQNLDLADNPIQKIETSQYRFQVKF